MKAMLICPSARPAVQLLERTAALSTVPLLGESLLEHWFSHLACSEVKEITVLADNGAEEVRRIIGNGARWGVKAKVIEESRELTPAQALLKHERELEPNTPSQGIFVLERFPGESQLPLFTSYNDLFIAVRDWMPRAISPDRVGVREVEPGVWVGQQSHIAADAQLHPPCWIGKSAFVGARCVIGPNAILEDGAFVEPDTSIAESLVSPHTFIGRFTELAGSIALGNHLINWSTGSFTVIPDPFVMCGLKRAAPFRTANWLARLVELYSGEREEDHELAKQLLMHKGRQG